MDSLPFVPTWYLKNPHAQTIWPTLARRVFNLELVPERIELPDKDFIDLAWDRSNFQDTKKPIVLIMHGLGGNIESPYAKGLMEAISRANWRPVFMHLRGSSSEPNRLDRIYHSGETEDVAFVVKHLQKHQVPLCAVGVSLSGNILLKWLGETGAQNPLTAVVAVSVPFELRLSADHMAQGFTRFYQHYLLNSLRQYLQRKYQGRPAPFDMSLAQNAVTFWEFDNIVTAPLHGFIDASDYYQQCSSRQYLPMIKTPTLIIHAHDDPFVPNKSIPKANEISSSTILNLTEHGGHVGFIGDAHDSTKRNYWLEIEIPNFLKNFL